MFLSETKKDIRKAVRRIPAFHLSNPAKHKKNHPVGWVFFSGAASQICSHCAIGTMYGVSGPLPAEKVSTGHFHFVFQIWRQQTKKNGYQMVSVIFGAASQI